MKVGHFGFFGYVFVPAILILFFGLAVYFTQLTFVIQHENVHKAIYDNYGIESEVYIDYVHLTGVTVGYDNDDKCNDNCLTLHSFNEIVSYNNGTLMLTFLMMTFIFIMIGIILYTELKFLNNMIFVTLKK